ncbi:MAG: DUF1638 domain-containing protein [Pseudomonadota bacterium]
MAETGHQRVCLIACGALAREILAVIDANGLDHVELRCLSALLHNRPERIPDAVREAIQTARTDGFDRILIGYADCGTGGLLDTVIEEEGVERIGGPHCYAFFSGTERFLKDQEEVFTAFFLTDFLARQFDSIIYGPLGLEKHPELRDLYFGNYDRVIYLAQTEDPELDLKARQAAEKLGLAFERRSTGYGELTDFVRSA